MNCIASTFPHPNNAWLFDIAKVVGDNALAVSSSANNIILYDCESLAVKHILSKAHDDVITGIASTNDAHSFVSSSRDGQVKYWDSRSRNSVKTYKANAGILSVAHHSVLDKLAIGTELKSSDAVVSIYDSRSPTAIASYSDSHSEDVTSLSWHASNNLLLSGGGDGIVNVIDTTVVDEDEAILQVLNHGASVHLAQFVGKNEVLALSHMETATLYKLSYNQEDVPRDGVKEYGDIRDALGIDYAISFSSGAQPILFTGSNAGTLSLIPLNTTSMEFDTTQRVDMSSGPEVVRSVYLDHAPDSLAGPRLYTASEDGILRAFSEKSAAVEDEKLARKRERRESKTTRKKDALRFEPY